MPDRRGVCGMGVLSDLVRREREDAASEAHVLESVGRGVDDLAEGRFVTSRSEMFTEAAGRREARA